MRWSAGQPSRNTAGKKDGGQALDLLTTALKTDSNKPKAEKYWTSHKFLCISLESCTLMLALPVRTRLPG